MKVELTQHQVAKLKSAGLVQVAGYKGYTAFLDPQTRAKYTFSPRGYAWRRSDAGTYQLNPRFKVAGNALQTKEVSATVRTNDSGALVEMVLHGVENFRN